MTRNALFACLIFTMLITLASFLFVIFAYTVPDKPFGHVAASEHLFDYGFGAHKALMILNLTAYKTSDTSDVEDRGLNGVHDIHPSLKRYAQLTMYKNNSVFNNVFNHPVAIDQKGGDRPQINLGIEFRDQNDIREDAKAELLDGFSTDLEDYFIRGCYFEASCTRDFTPTVMDVTPQKKGELVEVLFWQEGVGYTYEGVYGLFAKMKRKYYQKSVPWEDKGKIDKDDPCLDDLKDIAVVFESEKERVGRGSYNAFEKMVQADMVYPSSSKESYFKVWKDNCTQKYDQVVDYYHLPNLLNRSVVPLNLTTFVQMYMASQLMQQVDFGFRGAQQYYYKSPGSMDLMTGPPYDFDAPWDICGTKTIDIVTCHGVAPSPIWELLGRHAEFIHIWKTVGLDILARNMAAVKALYSERIDMYNKGYFRRHAQRWTMTGRVKGDLSRNLLALGRGSTRDTIGKELTFQLEWYEDRYEHMRRDIAESDGFRVYVTRGPYYVRFLQVFWWVFVFAGGPALLLLLWLLLWCGGCVRCERLSDVVMPREVVLVTVPRREMHAKRCHERR